MIDPISSLSDELFLYMFSFLSRNERAPCSMVSKRWRALIAPSRLTTIPDELLLSIFSHLSGRHLLVCKKIDKRWRAVSSETNLWKKLGSLHVEEQSTECSKAQMSMSSLLSRLEKGEISSMIVPNTLLDESITPEDNIMLFFSDPCLALFEQNTDNTTHEATLKIVNSKKPEKAISLKRVVIFEDAIVLDDSHIGVSCAWCVLHVISLKDGNFVNSCSVESKIKKIAGNGDAIYALLANGVIRKWEFKTNKCSVVYNLNEEDMDLLERPRSISAIWLEDNFLFAEADYSAQSNPSDFDPVDVRTMMWDILQPNGYSCFKMKDPSLKVKKRGDFIFIYNPNEPEDVIEILSCNKNLPVRQIMGSSEFEFMKNRYFVFSNFMGIEIKDMRDPEKKIIIKSDTERMKFKKIDSLLIGYDTQGSVNLINYENGTIQKILPPVENGECTITFGERFLAREYSDKREIWNMESLNRQL